MNIKISASITCDFPIISRLHIFFREFKNAGLDGVEIVSGIRSRFRLDYVNNLSKQYKLPITSMHQSAWSGVGLYFDEEMLNKAQKMGVKTVVFHPLAFTSMESKRMHSYFRRLAAMQKKYDIAICLENMKKEKVYRPLFSGGKEVRTHLKNIYDAAEAYGFYLTFDTSHARFTHPQREPSFEHMLPRLRNIHLSSFHQKQEHLPLTMGDFDTKGFLQYLVQNKYPGLLTFEVYYPRMVALHKYDFSAIKDSVDVIRRVADKLSLSRSDK